MTILGDTLLALSFIRSSSSPCYWKTTLVSLVPSRLRLHDDLSDQLCSIERPMHAQLIVFSLEWSVSHIAFPYVSGSAPRTSFSDTHA